MVLRHRFAINSSRKIHGAVLTVEMTILNIEKLCRSDLDSAEAGFHPQDPYR